MSKATELRLIERSISGDARRTMRNRSGDGDGEGAERWDNLVSVPSAEEEMIEAEDAAERREGQKRGIKLLRVYLRQVFDARERELIRAILEARDGQTVRESAAGIGLDITEGVRVRRSILCKWDRTGERLLAALRSSGFGAWRCLDFLSPLKRAEENLMHTVAYRALYPEKVKESKRVYHIMHCEEIRAKVRAYKAAHPEWARERRKAYEERHREEKRVKSRLYYSEHREEIRARGRAKRAAHGEEIRAKEQAYRAAHREEIRARQRAYRAAHREEFNARNRAYRAKKKEERKKDS